MSSRFRLPPIVCAILIVLCIPGRAAEMERAHSPILRGMVTGKQLPRFASLRSDVVNLRRGPGFRYRIDWVYHCRLLPVEIIRDFYNWRQVRMEDGTKGWIHQALLSNDRTFFVTVSRATLRHAPRTNSSPVAILRHAVVGHLQRCRVGSKWCSVRVGSFRGYLTRASIWGVLPLEAVGE